ncbi:MAG: hypothetical protein K8R74_14410 [Bacteroidales bacterium]|nr:hypothetical protein [Bacteroidales bacterium]
MKNQYRKLNFSSILCVTVTILMILNLNLKAQSLDDIGKIALSVRIVENIDRLDASQLSKLKSKITQIVTKSGLAASSYGQTFIIYPTFAVYDIEVVEGGLKNIYVATTELSLYIKQTSSGVVYASMSKELKGSGDTEKKAITNAISKISTSNKDFQLFIQEGKEKIIAYYESKCNDLIKEADMLKSMDKFDQAIGLLLSIPQEATGCYTKAQDMAVEIYLAKKERECGEHLRNAKLEMEKQDFSEALYNISQMDPTTSCYTDAEGLISKYQENICQSAILKAKSEFAQQRYSWGMRYISYVNPNTSCFQEASKLVSSFQDQISQDYLNRAKASLAIKNYKSAVYYLSKISSSSSAYPASQALMAKIDNSVTADERQKIDNEVKAREREIDLEKYRIDATKEIAMGYYNTLNK